MTLEEKQLFEKNKVAMACGTTLALASLGFALITLLEAINVLIVIRIVTSIVVLIILPVFFKKYGRQERYRLVVTVSMATLYLMNIFHSSSSQIYTIMYSIIIT